MLNPLLSLVRTSETRDLVGRRVTLSIEEFSPGGALCHAPNCLNRINPKVAANIESSSGSCQYAINVQFVNMEMQQ